MRFLNHSCGLPGSLAFLFFHAFCAVRSVWPVGSIGPVAAIWLAMAAMATMAPAWATDYAREKRFAEEVTAQLVVGEAVLLPLAGQPGFLGLWAESSGKTKPAIVLAHSVGTHPDDGVTGELRKRLHDMGYSTLAIQMPIAAKEAKVDDYFPRLFPLAAARLDAAALWLAARGYGRTVLVSHTMGSWMANVYFDNSGADKPANASRYAAWVCISLTGGYSFATRNYPFPILDLYGEDDIGVVVSSAWRRSSLLKLAATGSQQVKVAGADAQWRGKEAAAAGVIDGFIRQVLP